MNQVSVYDIVNIDPISSIEFLAYQYKAKSCHRAVRPRYGPGRPYRRVSGVHLLQ
jgi:hypothetical protein